MAGLSKTAKILKLLKEQGSATNRDLNRICYRYGARIYELRREGHDILTVRETAGKFRFVYKGEKETEQGVVTRGVDA